MPRFQHGKNILILVLLITLIGIPRELQGWRELAHARACEAAGDAACAASAYTGSASRLPWRSDLWEKAGLAAWQNGDAGTAIADLERAGKDTSLTMEGWLALGDARASLGDLPGAIQAWELAGNVAPAFERLAQAERAQGNLEAAARDWRSVLAIEPENAQAHYHLALFEAASDPESALTELMKVSGDPQLDAPAQALRTAINTALLSEDEPYRLVQIGRALAAQGHWDLAEAAFRQAVSVGDGYAPGWAWLGEAEQQLGRDGLPYLEKAAQLDPRSAMIHAFYGTYWMRQGQAEKAQAAFRLAVREEPEIAAWHTALGGAYEQGGDLPNALAEYQKAVELAPQDIQGWLALARYSASNRYDLAGTGTQAARNLLELAPDDWRALDAAGQVTFALGNLGEAQHLFERAVQVAPTEAAPHLHLALVLLNNRNLSQAREELNTVLTLDPEGIFGWQAERLLGSLEP